MFPRSFPEVDPRQGMGCVGIAIGLGPKGILFPSTHHAAGQNRVARVTWTAGGTSPTGTLAPSALPPVPTPPQ